MSDAGMERGPAARRELVRRRVLDVGFARVDDLLREFDVSLMTMHRDLDALEAEGYQPRQEHFLGARELLRAGGQTARG